MEKIRVALFAGQDLGYVMADYFSSRNDIDLFIVSYQSPRDIINGYRTALTIARERQIIFLETDKPQDALIPLRKWNPDIIVGAYYAKLFSAELLAVPRLGALNVHPGKFPRYQGPMPTPWYILNGEKTFGIGIFQIDSGIDTGPIFVEKEYPISQDETGHGLLRRTMEAAADIYIDYFDKIARGEIEPIAQKGEPEFCPRIEPYFHIDWTVEAQLIERHIRVHAKPYFPAFSFLHNCLVSINRAAVSEQAKPPIGKPGEITALSRDGNPVIICGDGCLIVREMETFPPLNEEERSLYFKIGAVLK